jgi:hypothetical protein
MKSSILNLLMHGSCRQTTSIDATTNLLLSLTLFMVKVAEPAVMPILASSFCMKTAATAEPSKMPKRTQ